jgi:hypothetical protein
MKPQQRNFVVEIKSTRRRTKLPPKSIWGDTDFKALAREAEAVHLTGDEVVSEALRRDVALPTSPEMPAEYDAIVPNGSDKPNEAHPAAANQEPATDVVPQAEAAAPPRAWRKVSKLRREKGLRPPAEGQPAAEVDLSPADRTSPPQDELSLLEEENQRLSQLLAEHLRQQNMLLRKMLKRFATT